MSQFDLFATVPKGIESLLLHELKHLGAEKLRKIRAGVSFQGDLETAYRICLWSRLASRILLKLHDFSVNNEEDLYRACYDFPWEEHFAPEQTFAVDATLVGAKLDHSHYAALKTKDAVVDRFRDQTGRRPSVDTREPDVRINLHLRRTQGSLALDLSGESLHRRGYRRQAGKAPLKENLAAALLIYADWPEIAAAGGMFCDPMCGSGTLPIEAALIAADLAPGLLRRRFGFERWRRHDQSLWQELQAEAETRKNLGLKQMPCIIGYDSDRQVLGHARANAEAAGVDRYIRFEQLAIEARFADSDVTAESGLVLTNPPYGERLGERKKLRPLYARIGERLRSDFAGWKAAVLSADRQLDFALGLRPADSVEVYNGAITCRLLRFNLPDNPPGATSTRQTVQPRPSTAGAEMFANRLRKNQKRFGKWARKNGINCYRVYDADMPEYAVAIDLYGDRVHLQEYAPPSDVDEEAASRRLDDVLEVLPDVLSVPRENVVVKIRQRQKGTSQYRRQALEGDFFEVTEGAARFLVNLTDYLDTGLFLDHRPVRRMIGKLAGDRRFLNLFAYTGTATVHAAHGGAVATTSVDMSKTYLDWAGRNFDLNGLNPDAHERVQADCTEWLKQADEQFDLIFIDPPTFSNSKRMDLAFEVQRDHVDLLKSAAGLLAPGGELIFSTNYRRFRFAHEAFPDMEVQDISAQSIPEDFKRNPRIHQCFLLQRRADLD